MGIRPVIVSAANTHTPITTVHHTKLTKLSHSLMLRSIA